MCVPAYIWQFFFLCVPLILIAILSVVSLGKCGHFHSFTGEFFSYFLSPLYARVALRSLALATTNAIACLFIAYPLAYFLAFKAHRFKYVGLFFLILPFWTNFLLHVYAWYFVLDYGGFLNTLLLKMNVISSPLHMLNTLCATMIMMIYYYMPFMALPLYVALDKFDYRFIEASFDLGATWWQTIRKILIPLTMSGIMSGFFLVFVPSFAEFAIPELMGGDKYMFVGSVVTYFMVGGLTMSYGSASTILSSLVLVVSAYILYWLIKKIIRML